MYISWHSPAAILPRGAQSALHDTPPPPRGAGQHLPRTCYTVGLVHKPTRQAFWAGEMQLLGHERDKKCCIETSPMFQRNKPQCFNAPKPNPMFQRPNPKCVTLSCFAVFVLLIVQRLQYSRETYLALERWTMLVGEDRFSPPCRPRCTKRSESLAHVTTGYLSSPCSWALHRHILRTLGHREQHLVVVTNKKGVQTNFSFLKQTRLPTYSVKATRNVTQEPAATCGIILGDHDEGELHETTSGVLHPGRGVELQL
jgi:hypothetical protein